MSLEAPKYSDGFKTRIRRQKSEFRNEGDALTWASLRVFLSKTIPNYEEIYVKVEPLLIDWHKTRVEINDLPLNSKLIKIAKEIEDKNMEPYNNPKSKSYIPDYKSRFSPALKSISNEVSKIRR